MPIRLTQGEKCEGKETAMSAKLRKGLSVCGDPRTDQSFHLFTL